MPETKRGGPLFEIVCALENPPPWNLEAHGCGCCGFFTLRGVSMFAGKL